MANEFIYNQSNVANGNEFDYKTWVNGGGVREVAKATDLPATPEATCTIYITRDLNEMWWYNPNTHVWVKLGNGSGPSGTVSWGQILGNIENQYDLQTALALKADLEHNHNTLYYGKSEVDIKLAEKAALDHNHNDLYYGKTTVDTKLAEKANVEAAVPQGGTAGQVLAKKSGSNYDTEWVTPSASVEIDNKTIIRGDDGKLKTALGGYVESGTVKIFDGAFTSKFSTMAIAVNSWVPFSAHKESYSCTLDGYYIGDGVQHNISGTYTLVDADGTGHFYEAGLVPGSLSLRMYGPMYEETAKQMYCEYSGSVVVTESQLSCTVYGTDVYHKIGGNFIPVDGTTIALDDAGRLTVVAPSGKEYIQEVTTLPTSPISCVLYARTTDKTVWIYLSGEWVCVNSGAKSVESVDSVSSLPTVGKSDTVYIVKDTERLYTYYSASWHCVTSSDQFTIYDSKESLPTYGVEGRLYFCRAEDTFYYYSVVSSVGTWKKIAEYNEINCSLD